MVLYAPAQSNAVTTAIQSALSQVGVPYSWGAESPGTGFDCSGLVQWSYRQAGIMLGRTTYQQILQGQGVPTSPSAWLPGDLIFPDTGHVQMYLGGGQIVEAPQTGQDVHVVKEWATSVVAVRRVAPGGDTAQISTTNLASATLSSTTADVDSSVNCLISLPSLAGIGGGCLLSDQQGRDILGGLLMLSGAALVVTGVALLVGSNKGARDTAMTIATVIPK